MVKKGYCKTIKECFEKYIGLGKPAYSEKVGFSAEDAIRAINSSGGLSFLAHLHQTNYDINQLEALLIKLKKAGLTGIEGYYTEYTPEHVRQYRELALKLGLAISGGSDFHADIKPHIEIGVGEGNLKIPYYVYENLKGLKGRK
jgi:predicted metal-dependent phosphoesterase TrpH